MKITLLGLLTVGTVVVLVLLLWKNFGSGPGSMNQSGHQ